MHAVGPQSVLRGSHLAPKRICTRPHTKGRRAGGGVGGAYLRVTANTYVISMLGA